MVGKKVKVLTEGGWVGPVIDVLDRENILVLKNGKTVKANIFDVRSL
jgi:preprotein translocase subunit YajC